MKIRNRLYISAAISIVLAIILVVTVVLSSNKVTQEMEKQSLAMDMNTAVLELDIVTHEYLLYRENRMEQQWFLRYKSMEDVLEEAAKNIRLPLSMLTSYTTLYDSFSQVTANSFEIQRLTQEGASQQEIDIALEVEERLVAQLLIASHSIIADTSTLAEEAHTGVTEAQRLTSNLTLALMIFLAITVTTSSLLIARSISKPLDELTKGAEIIGKGNLEHKVVVKTKDELGQLAAAFNEMTENLGETTASRDELDREVTVRKQAEEALEKHAEQLERANTRLQEVDRLKSVFLASMSHELRTPLNSIIGFTGIILQGMSGEVNEEQRKQLTMVKNSASHLLSLINDVLDISKIEAGKVELSLGEFGLDDVVREVVETVSPTASEKSLELLTDVPEGITLFSDRRRVKQVLMNLMSNAVKFTDQGSVKIAARVSGDDILEVRVIDTGIGIKQEDMNKLFQPFQQIDISLTKKHEGTGLGLYLTKRLLVLLGGDISAKSEYGKGSEFSFTIPLRYKEGNQNEKDTGG